MRAAARGDELAPQNKSNIVFFKQIGARITAGVSGLENQGDIFPLWYGGAGCPRILFLSSTRDFQRKKFSKIKGNRQIIISGN